MRHWFFRKLNTQGMNRNSITLELPRLTPDNRYPSHPVLFEFDCAPSDGAVLVLPHGASQTNLRFRRHLQEYARQNVLSWYEYAYGTLGLEVEAGPLILITGYDKCKSWCVASYANIPPERAVSLSFAHRGVTFGGNCLIFGPVVWCHPHTDFWTRTLELNCQPMCLHSWIQDDIVPEFHREVHCRSGRYV